MKKGIKNTLIKWFYHTDAILDDSDLDSFHDKSIVSREANDLAIALTIYICLLVVLALVLGLLIGKLLF